MEKKILVSLIVGILILLLATQVLAQIVITKSNGKNQYIAQICVATSSGYGTPAYACDEQFSNANDIDYCKSGETKVTFGCYYSGEACTLPGGNTGSKCNCTYACKKTPIPPRVK